MQTPQFIPRLQQPQPIRALPIYKLTRWADEAPRWTFIGKLTPFPRPAANLSMLADTASMVAAIAMQKARHLAKPPPALPPLDIARARKIADFEAALWELKLSERAKEKVRRLALDILY